MDKKWLQKFQDRYLAPIRGLSSRCFADTVNLRKSKVKPGEWLAETKEAMKEILQITQEAISLLEDKTNESQEPK